MTFSAATKVKICGINSEPAYEAVIKAKADYAGFVFYKRSPRYLPAQKAGILSSLYPKGPKLVGLFVNPLKQDIQTVLDALPLDILQIYGDPSLCRDLKAQFGLPVWHAIGIVKATDLPQDDHGVDGFIIEAKSPPNASRPGGNATMLDWTLLKDWSSPIPWMLAGGLTAENVAAGISETAAPGVDVSSGVETLPGLKSPALIRRFISNARSAARPAR